jgi:BRCA1 C Terminus (BRCT) domain
MTSVDIDGSALASSIAFTGRLACMSRADAFDVVRQRGGTPSPAVTRRTQVLIVGELGWPLLDDGRPSNKLSRATALGIPIVSKRRFLEWVGKAVPDDVQKTYSAEQLATLSKSPIRHLEKLGTISPTFWMIRAGPKLPLNVCAKPLLLRRTTSMRRSILRCCCSGKARMRRPQTIGGGIWRVIARRDGPPARGAR